jgi:hypothetical protein
MKKKKKKLFFGLGKEKDDQSSLCVDTDGIPILDDVIPGQESEHENIPTLDDVVTPEEIGALQSPSPLISKGLNLPDHAELLHAIRNELKQQLQGELEPLIAQLANEMTQQIIDDLELNLAHKIESRLKQSTQETIDDFLERRLKRD